MLALISLYAPVVIIILAVVAVLFSFFWVFLPLPTFPEPFVQGMSKEPTGEGRNANVPARADVAFRPSSHHPFRL